MIYDCFPFFNEIDLLEIRFNELYDVVDYFVISEATVTHQNGPHELCYLKHRDRFRDFEDKIIYNIIGDASSRYHGNPWNIDYYMHDNIDSVLSFHPEDVIIIGDADQIVRASILKDFKYTCPLQLQMQYSYYFFNCVHTSFIWESSFIVQHKDIKVPRHVIRYDPPHSHLSFQKVPNAGWHYSYMGGIEKIREKIQAFSDTSVNRPEFLSEEHLLRVMAEGKDVYNRTCEGPMIFVPIEEACPEYVLKNQERFEKYLRRIG